MRFSALHGAAGGVLVTGAVVALVVRPPALLPHPAATALDLGSEAPPAHERPVRATPAALVVYVAGAVVHPGVYALANGARAVDAVAKAGGLTRDADAVAVNLAARVADGDEIAVPHAGDAAVAAGAHHRESRRTAKRAHRGRHRRSSDRGATAALPAGDDAGRPIDLNAADAPTLATIPGIGPALAERIVAFREQNGPFASVDALSDVSGITPSRFDAIAAYLTVGRP